MSFGEHSIHFCWGNAYLWNCWLMGIHALASVDTENFPKFLHLETFRAILNFPHSFAFLKRREERSGMAFVESSR